MKLKKGDNVIVIAGKNKGKKGTIAKILVEKNRVVIEGVNVMKKHVRAKKNGEKGQVISIAMPFHASNVMIVDPKTGKPSRIGKKKVGEKMVRIARKSGQEI